MHCNTLQHITLLLLSLRAGPRMLQHTTTLALQHCNTLQHITFSTFACGQGLRWSSTAKFWNTNCNKYPATHCNSMQHTTTYCNILQLSLCCYCRLRAGPWIVQHTATHCNTHTATYCNTHGNILQHTYVATEHAATHCNTLQHTATHNTLQHTSVATATCGQGLGWRNTLQLTATHNNTLQLTATLCNALHYAATHGSVSLCFYCCCG